MYDRKKSEQQQAAPLEEMKRTLADALEQYQEDPALLAEALAFKDRFYEYSMNNAMLIRTQNPHATYVAGYSRWQELGYQVLKGQHAIKIFLPIHTKLFPADQTPDGKTAYKKVTEATQAEAAELRAGIRPIVDWVSFRVGNVFDISQTDCPAQDYPKLFNMGYSSDEHAQLYESVKRFAQQRGITVGEADMSSISLRGTYDRISHTITINDKLNDTQKLDTLAHELGHAVTLGTEKGKEALRVHAELQADAISIMLQTHFGLELTDARKMHFAEHCKACAELPQHDLKEFLQHISSVYLTLRQELDPVIEQDQQTISDAQKAKGLLKSQTEKSPSSKEPSRESPHHNNHKRQHGPEL